MGPCVGKNNLFYAILDVNSQQNSIISHVGL